MSDLVFPTLSGCIVQSRERLDNVSIFETASGKEQRIGRWAAPRYRYKLGFDFLRSIPTWTELQALEGFTARVRGRFDSFLWSDPEDSVVASHAFSVGTGAATTFQLQRSLVPDGALPVAAARAFWPVVGDGYEPVYDLASVPILYRTDWQGTQQLYSTPRTNVCTRSQDPGNAAWSKLAGGTGTVPVVTSNAGAAPDGTTTAALVHFDKGAGNTTSDSSTLSSAGFTTVNGQSYAISVWLRTSDGTTKVMDLSLNSLAQANITVTPTYQRFMVTGVGDGVSRGLRLDLRGTFGTAVSADVLMWGAQLETGTVPTSYIPTTSTAATVTDYILGANGVVTLAAAPAVGAVLSWSGSYWKRVRFDSDSLTVERLVSQLWKGSGVDLISVPVGGGTVTVIPPASVSPSSFDGALLYP